MAENTSSTEFWEKTGALECFASGEKGFQYKNGHVFSTCFGGLRVTDLSNCQVVGKAETEEDPILSFSLDPQSDIVYTSHKSKLIRAWHGVNLEPYINFSPMKTDHKGPIILITVHGSTLITASAESVLKVWNLEQRHCSGVLRNCQALPLCIEYVEFENVGKIVLCGTNSGSIHAWNAETNDLIGTGSKHFSQISAIKALPETRSYVSAGRDKTLVFWSWNLQPLKVIPSFEELESIEILPKSLALKIINKPDYDGENFIIASGDKSNIRIWNSKDMTEILPDNEKKDFSLTSKGVLIKSEKVNQLIVAPQTENFEESVVICQDDFFSQCRFSGKKNKIEKTVISSNQHEILEMITMHETFLIVATMSPVLRIYDLKSGNTLKIASGGHSDAVLSLNIVDGEHFVSCGKDHSVGLWNIDLNGNAKLIAKGTGHSSFVGAVASSAKSIFSASKDGILKVNIYRNSQKHESTLFHTYVLKSFF